MVVPVGALGFDGYGWVSDCFLEVLSRAEMSVVGIDGAVVGGAGVEMMAWLRAAALLLFYIVHDQELSIDTQAL